MTGNRKKISIIWQVALLFLAAILITGAISFFAQRGVSNDNVMSSVENIAGEVAEDVRLSFHEYPAADWLLRYWYEHAAELDIDYSGGFTPGSGASEKFQTLAARHPDIAEQSHRAFHDL